MSGTVATTAVKTQSSVLAADTVGTTTTATTFGTSWTAPANFLTVGRGLRVTARGIYSTLGSTGGTLALELMGGTTTLATTGGQTVTLSLTNSAWEMTADVICGLTGAAGWVEAQGRVGIQVSGTTASDWFMSNTAGVSLNTTVAQAIVPRVTWSVSGNTITMRTLVVETMGQQ